MGGMVLRSRISRLLTALATLLLWLAPAVAADGLSRFEAAIKAAQKNDGAPVAYTAAASGAPSCTPGARFFIAHEDGWYSATVRDMTKSGDKCVARIDGSDDDVVFATADALAWSIDGPGKAVDKCNSGDKVLALDPDGGWYAAKVSGEAADAKCLIKYESDGEEESVELKRLRRLD